MGCVPYVGFVTYSHAIVMTHFVYVVYIYKKKEGRYNRDTTCQSTKTC
jgi:hypothetical protein